MARHHTHRSLPQHRHQCAHRCGQNHDHRAHPVLHRGVAQDGRGARWRHGDGLDGAGARARHHHHVGCHHLLLEGDGGQVSRAPHQHHRHARPRRLHHRSRALDARARWRLHGVRLGRRRAAAIGDGLAAGQQVQSAAAGVRQQDGPRRRGLLQSLPADARAPAGQSGRDSGSDRRRGQVRRRRRSGAHEGDLLGRQHAGDEVRVPRHPRRADGYCRRSGARRWSRPPPRPTRS